RSQSGSIGNPGSYVAIDARIEAYGSGCPGTGGTTPVLSGIGCPTAGGYTILRVDQGLPSAPALLIYGSARSSIAFGGCTLLAFPTLAPVPLTRGTSGSFQTRLDVPYSIASLELPLQVAVMDSGAANGLSATAAIELVIR